MAVAQHIKMEQRRQYTVEDIYALPDGQRAELIDGRWYDMASPSRIHQEIVSELTREIGNHIREKGGNCRVYPAPFAVLLNKDDKTYVEPDVSVICDPSKLTDRGCSGAPELVIEVVSPSSERMDYAIKLFKYRSAGVKEYWVINPGTRMINTYVFANEEENETARQLSFDEELVSSMYPDFHMILAEQLS